MSKKNGHISRLDSDEFLPEDDGGYVDVNKLHELYAKLAFEKDSNVVLCGPKGIGKSLSTSSHHIIN